MSIYKKHFERLYQGGYSANVRWKTSCGRQRHWQIIAAGAALLFLG
jgi:hypothetical protein